MTLDNVKTHDELQKLGKRHPSLIACPQAVNSPLKTHRVTLHDLVLWDFGTRISFRAQCSCGDPRRYTIPVEAFESQSYILGVTLEFPWGIFGYMLSRDFFDQYSDSGGLPASSTTPPPFSAPCRCGGKLELLKTGREDHTDRVIFVLGCSRCNTLREIRFSTVEIKQFEPHFNIHDVLRIRLEEYENTQEPPVDYATLISKLKADYGE